MSPRISFSNDFGAVERPPVSYRDAPVSSDFEFSSGNESHMITADQVFSKGRILPSGDGGTQRTAAKLRDELLSEDGDGDEFSLRPPKNPASWRGFWGLKKSHIGSRKAEKDLRDEES
ncbi:hypothetical protein M569_02280 [Genlisea aurea]|uniref:Uncharacterized protein n=1 Tax=Genlisea aurea TaxID=192259 RepID=S8E9D3_9LAMI|nr:hypothetical protein M569_02280 [Genlisea aurea]